MHNSSLHMTIHAMGKFKLNITQLQDDQARGICQFMNSCCAYLIIFQIFHYSNVTESPQNTQDLGDRMLEVREGLSVVSA